MNELAEELDRVFQIIAPDIVLLEGPYTDDEMVESLAVILASCVDTYIDDEFAQQWRDCPNGHELCCEVAKNYLSEFRA